MENTEVVYKKVNNVKLKNRIFIPKDWSINDKRVAIIFFFGGGWVNGNIDHFKEQSLYLSNKGFVAITPEYRTKSKYNTTPYECVEDGIDAINWIIEHSDDLGIDPDKIIVAGGSAGGHIALSTFLIPGKELLKKPYGLVLFNPVCDTTETGYGYEKIGANPKSLSPIHHIKKNMPPTLIFHGTDDTIVPFENATRFFDKMKTYNNKCELVSYDGQGHGFFNHEANKVNPYYIDTIKRTEEFVKSLV